MIEVVWWLHSIAPILRGLWLSSAWTTNQVWLVESGAHRMLTRASFAWIREMWTSAKWWKHLPCWRWWHGIQPVFARSPYPSAASRLSQIFLALGPQSVDVGLWWNSWALSWQKGALASKHSFLMPMEAILSSDESFMGNFLVSATMIYPRWNSGRTWLFNLCHRVACPGFLLSSACTEMSSSMASLECAPLMHRDLDLSFCSKKL